jgi:hypothetical protein
LRRIGFSWMYWMAADTAGQASSGTRRALVGKPAVAPARRPPPAVAALGVR